MCNAQIWPENRQDVSVVILLSYLNTKCKGTQITEYGLGSGTFITVKQKTSQIGHLITI